jgi:FlaA1/EpsC-like NDP-sugar epimerase
MMDLMLNLSRPQKRLVSVVADIAFLFFALWAAMSIRLGDFYLLTTDTVALSFSVTVTSTIIVFVKLGLYRAVIRYLSGHALFAIVVGVTISTLIFLSSSFLLKAPVPRSAPIIYWSLALLFVSGSRMLVRSYTHQLTRKKNEPVVIYGAGRAGLQLATALSQGADLHPIAYIDDDESKQGSIIQGLRIYSPADLGFLIKKRDPKRILLALGRASKAQRALILRFLEPYPVLVQTVPDMSEVVNGQAKIEEIRDIEIEDLLGRDAVTPDAALLETCITGKSVLVTGAGGSIGSELCRQIIKQKPRRLVLFELSEFGLYSIERELKQAIEKAGHSIELVALLGSVQHKVRMRIIMSTFGVQTVYHAAAYKHVPLVEHNVIEGVRNNVFGTWHTAEAAIEAGVERFVLISTDKAVRPTNVMGATKRMAELVLQGLSKRQSKTLFCMVRFGNVLGSSGSVVPLFREQIRKGGPVTVTHPDIIRYFMTIPEAAQLVIQAGAMGVGGDVFVLDMGEQVKIVDLAYKMIRLMGYDVKDKNNPHGDIEVVFTGLRPGEKLFEELLVGECSEGTAHSRIMKAHELDLPWEKFSLLLDSLDQHCHTFDCHAILDLLLSAPLSFTPKDGVNDLVCQRKRPLVKEVKVVPISDSIAR